MRLVSDWVTSLRISPRTCTRRACSGYVVDCTSVSLVPRRYQVVDYYVVQRGFASGGQVGATTSASIQLPGTFLGLGLDLGSNRLYDLIDDIPDVMGLRALRPSVAICKVMSVPDSRCVRVVTPDDHVNIGFHEIIIHDLADEEWPLVTLSDLGCLRLEWPKPLFTFMSRYQFDLDQMRKECGKRFGSTQSRKCTTCGKHIQMNLGKHVTLYHMELAQLWHCPVWWVRSGRGLRRTGWIT